MVPSCCQCDCYLPFKNVFGPSNCARSIIWSNSFGDLEGTWLRYKKKVWELQKIALFQNKSMVQRATSKKIITVWQYLIIKSWSKQTTNWSNLFLPLPLIISLKVIMFHCMGNASSSYFIEFYGPSSLIVTLTSFAISPSSWHFYN